MQPSGDLDPISKVHFAAIACELAMHIYTAQRAMSGEMRQWEDLTPADRGRRVEQAAWIIRLQPIPKEALA